jgi:hypothetical protein
MVNQPASPNFIGIDRSRGLDNPVVTMIVEVGNLLDPVATARAAYEGIRERGAQDRKWGESNHLDVPVGVKFPCAFFGIPSAEAARLHCETAFRTGTGSNAHILLKEVSEAIEAARDPVYLRAELVQVMAVCMKWVEQIDRRRGYGGVDGSVLAVDELDGRATPMADVRYVLQETSVSRKRGRPVYFAGWTAIGPALNEDLADADRFDTPAEAMRSPAWTFMLTIFEVVEVPHV